MCIYLHQPTQLGIMFHLLKPPVEHQLDTSWRTSGPQCCPLSGLRSCVNLFLLSFLVFILERCPTFPRLKLHEINVSGFMFRHPVVMQSSKASFTLTSQWVHSGPSTTASRLITKLHDYTLELKVIVQSFGLWVWVDFKSLISTVPPGQETSHTSTDRGLG